MNTSSTITKGPADNSIVLKSIPSPLGKLVAGATSEGICLLEFGDGKSPANGHGTASALKHLKRLERELTAYFAGELREFTVPLAFDGTPFQVRVWKALLKIPYGKTCSYEDVARRVGDKKAVRAVGTANGRNHIAIVIPCHRVVNKSGALGGYGGGLKRKQFLLDLELTRTIPVV
jgi:O-6-methylguanine DNA methyltransferase